MKPELKAMISQPMRDKTTEQIRAEREAAVKWLDEKGYLVVDTVYEEMPLALNPNVARLSKAIRALSDVHAVCFIGDWRNARGCKIERAIAEAYGVEILEFAPDDFALPNKTQNNFCDCEHCQ
ncbi:MAG: DUF4406 domain-containing protein [Helicobacteraceae bacterium]|jgi:hypothetical protein|nr:DUF4406 domain-containing protein [Helicobacteraceae bacterium]